ncbi:Uncharacterised protein [Budvicia aquatica]|uniref:Uncharacterized protein n=1 Tax=Budvicia aquatica TaxID=82979 RepID=A0A484ZGI8_9GAMM|nr:hypothetical protein [Budvicia aquatica]VFS47118.1 Uncharacterised protein [Budvicia aquatica]
MYWPAFAHAGFKYNTFFCQLKQLVAGLINVQIYQRDGHIVGRWRYLSQNIIAEITLDIDLTVYGRIFYCAESTERG